MISIEFKKSICRILADLVKSDNVISVDEIAVLEMQEVQRSHEG